MNSVYVRLISRNSNGHNALYNAKQSWPLFYWRQNFFNCFLIVPFLLLTLGRTCKFIPPPWYKGGWMDPPQTFWYVAVFRNDFTFKGCDHGYAHARGLSLPNKFVGSALNSKSPLLGTIIENPSFYSDIRRFGWPSYTLVVVISVWLCFLTGYVLRRRKK